MDFSFCALIAYRNGFTAELRGSTRMAVPPLTCAGMAAAPVKDSRPIKPTGNQHRKSVRTTEVRRRGSLDPPAPSAVLEESVELLCACQWTGTWNTATSTNSRKLVTVVTPSE